MVFGKIKPAATIVAQFAAGVEVEAIQHEGKMFLPIVGMGEFAVKDNPPARKSEPVDTAEEEAPKETKTKKTSTKAETTSYTEEELMDMETKELLKLCKSLGIDPDATDGKNTNKKLRKLILAKQDAVEDEDEDDEDGAGDDSLVSAIGDILEDFDGGKKNKKKTIAAICALNDDDADEDAITDLVEAFEDDADADIDETAEKIAKVLSGDSSDEGADDDDEEEDEKPKSKKSKKSSKDEDLVAPEDLEVGDRVSVWWDDDNQEWFDGEVKSISKKGKIVIAYDDDTEDALDAEVNTKIKRIK